MKARTMKEKEARAEYSQQKSRHLIREARGSANMALREFEEAAEWDTSRKADANYHRVLTDLEAALSALKAYALVNGIEEEK